LRGFDVTKSVPVPPGDEWLNVRYDEAWHSEADRERIPPAMRLDEGFFSLSRYLENWIAPAELFDCAKTPT
jgi:hypothetical protein